ncbi:MAG: T9SS type A sorting domain-containing protein, partial [bacterium]
SAAVRDAGRGRSATVGVEDASGRVALQYLWDGQPTGNLLCEGRAIRFLPMPPGVSEAPPTPVHGLRLDVRPNPAGRDAVVFYNVPVRSTARVTLLDAAGRVIAVLADGRHDTGHYTVRLDSREGRPLQAGVYFVQLTTDSGRLQKKLVRTE